MNLDENKQTKKREGKGRSDVFFSVERVAFPFPLEGTWGKDDVSGF